MSNEKSTVVIDLGGFKVGDIHNIDDVPHILTDTGWVPFTHNYVYLHQAPLESILQELKNRGLTVMVGK